MNLDHKHLAEMAAIFFQKNKIIANVTAIQEVGQRNPRATFTVVGTNGAVLQVEVKRLMKGVELPPEPAKPKPKRKKPTPKKAAKK